MENRFKLVGEIYHVNTNLSKFNHKSVVCEIQPDNYLFGSMLNEGYYLITREVSLSHSEATVSDPVSFNFTLSMCITDVLYWHQPNFLNFILAPQGNYFTTDAESNYCSNLGTSCQIIHDSQNGEAAFVRFIYLNYTPGSKG